jgi:glycosyltransferase involved in cell wall biosynthesis
VRVVYNAVNWDKLTTTRTPDEVRRELAVPPGQVVFTVIATLQEKKGHRVLLDAMASTAELVGAALLVIGDGPLRVALETRARELGLQDRVRFCGTRRDLGNVLSVTDVFVLPSLWEGLPLALLLALGAGRPVVASALAGVPEVVTDGVTGLLVPPGDAAALGAAMARLCNSEDERRRFGDAARDAVSERFGADHYVRAIAGVYEECLADIRSAA